METRLTGRDVAILIDMYHYRYLRFSQLSRLHFPSDKTAYRRLQILVEGGYLKTFYAPAIPERIFYLTTPGAKIVASEMEKELEELAWYRYSKTPKDYYFLRHFLAINDFRILITQVCRESAISLLGFIPEYIGEKTKQGFVKKYIRDSAGEYSHTPDAVFALEKDNNAALFFVEIDRGLEVVSDPEKGMLKAIVFYLNYWVSERWQRYNADFQREFKTFRTLVITTSKDRLQHIRDEVTKLPFTPSHAKRFLWGTIQSQATHDWIFESIWHSLDNGDTNLYKIG